MIVSCLYFEIYSGEKKAVTYKNSRTTSLEINESNEENMTTCARARWKTGNGHNNGEKKSWIPFGA